MNRLNNRPRKRLGYQTPNQVFFKSGVALQTWTREVSDMPNLKEESLDNGIYIIACNGAIDKRLPNVENEISNIFKNKGFKISDTLEGSSYAIAFSINGDIDIVKADKQVAHSALPNANQVANHVGTLANSVLSGVGNGVGGATGLAGWVIAEMLQTDSNFKISTTLFKNPTKYKGFLGERIKGSDDVRYGTAAFVFYKLEKGKEASDDIVLKMAVNEWIDHFMPVQNVNSQIAEASPASISKPAEPTQAQ